MAAFVSGLGLLDVDKGNIAVLLRRSCGESYAIVLAFDFDQIEERESRIDTYPTSIVMI